MKGPQFFSRKPPHDYGDSDSSDEDINVIVNKLRLVGILHFLISSKFFCVIKKVRTRLRTTNVYSLDAYAVVGSILAGGTKNL